MKRLSVVGVIAFCAASSFAAVPFKLGIAGYTFLKTPLDKSLATMKAIDCHYLCIKDFHLAYEPDAAAIASFKAKCADAGVECLGAGPLYSDDEAKFRRIFEFAKMYGIGVIVGVPFENVDHGNPWGKDTSESDRMLDVVERLVKEFDIRFAIHNHGPDMPYLYPTAESVMKRIAQRDRRIGLCLDIGHERRAGVDPVVTIRKYASRIYDVHLKNIKIDPKKNLAMQGPRGELDICGVFRALSEVGYTGVCHLEYERDFEDNAMGLAESIGFYRGVISAIDERKLK